MAPRVNVSPSASATATVQPHQAGTRQIPRDLAATLSRIINTLREATASAVNPRIAPATAEALSRRSLELQTEASQIATRLDALHPNSDGQLAIYHDLNLLGGEVQAYVQAVVDALRGVGEGLQTVGGPALGRLGVTLTDEEKTKQTWIYFGVGTAVVLAGLGLFLVIKHKPSRGVGKITGAMSAR